MPAISKVDICNFALQEVGESAITSLSDNNTRARECSLRYDQARRTTLEMGIWNFALKRQSLALSAEAPGFGYSHAFTLPQDFLRIVMTEQEEDSDFYGNPFYNGYKVFSFDSVYSARDDYRLENGKLLYNEQVCKIIYLFDQEDTGKFSSLFVELFTKILASRIAYRLTGSRTLQREKEEEAQVLYKKEALTTDAQQGTRFSRYNSTLVSARY